MADTIQFVSTIPPDTILDNFDDRTTSASWQNASGASASVRPRWVASLGTAANFAVTGDTGRITLDAAGSGATHQILLSTPVPQFDITTKVRVPVLATGATIRVNVFGRYWDGNNHYRTDVLFLTDGTVSQRIQRQVAGLGTELVVASTGESYTAGSWWHVRFQLTDESTWRAKVWEDGSPEPGAWTVSVVDVPVLGPGRPGVGALRETGNTNGTITLEFDDFEVVSEPVVILDLNQAPFAVLHDGTDVSPPPLVSATASTLLRDGSAHPASAYGDRLLRLRVAMQATTADAAAEALGALFVEVNRPSNIIRWHPDGATHPVYFRTYRSPVTRVNDLVGQSGSLSRTIELELSAEPFAYGAGQVFPAKTVVNDPAEGTTLNANPYFETDTSNWTVSGGSIARSTAQFHEGAASLLLTPDGVSVQAVARNDVVLNIDPSGTYRISAWLRCATARTVALNVDWHTAAGAFISTSASSAAVAANTWTLFDFTPTTPATAGRAGITASMDSTPPAGDLLYIDEARIRRVGDGGMSFDVTGVMGDVDTPAVVRFSSAVASKQMLLSVRSREATGWPFALQAETMSNGTDTTNQAYDAVMSGVGSNYARTTFSTTTMVNRKTMTQWPAPFVDISTAYRGRYRVFLRYRKSNATDTIRVRLLWGGTTTTDAIVGSTVTLAASTQRRFADLGLVSLPIGADPVGLGLSGLEAPVAGVPLAVQAERAAGSGTLDLDCLLFVPAERITYAQWPSTLSGDDYGTLDGVNDMSYVEIDAGGPSALGDDIIPTAGLYPALQPRVTNRLYVLANVGTTGPEDSVTLSTVVTVLYWPRFLYVRPPSP